MKERKFFLVLFLLLASIAVSAQKRDAVWAFGDSTGIDFNDLANPVPITTSSSYTDENNTSISDEQGNLQFYLGGVADSTGYAWYLRMRVFNKNGEIMENGDSIQTDYSETNGLMIIPFPDDSNKYYLFHLKRVDYQSALYYSIIDMSYNNGLGKVISKNILLSSVGDDSLCEKLAAVKHGNGKDWWLVCHQYYGSNYYEYRITSSGITGPYFQNAGSCFCGLIDFAGEMCFSKDGSRLLNVSFGIVDVMNFDRCSGNITVLAELGDSVFPEYPWYYGCSFSPNGRFIYVSDLQAYDYSYNNQLFQLDLEAPSIPASKYLVYEGPGGYSYSLIFQHQLGPDDKIYISFQHAIPYYYSLNADSTNLNLSVIENPDSTGLACSFNPFSFYMDGRMMGGGLPNMPNYNLGSIGEGSDCDSISDAVNSPLDDNGFHLYPNPANEKINITFDRLPNASSDLLVCDLSGHQIKNIQLTHTSTVTEISLHDFKSGIYIVTLSEGEKILGRRKLVVSK